VEASKKEREGILQGESDMRDRYPNDAYDEDYNAYWDGVDVSDNPCDNGTEERRFWEDGWRAARKHDYDESEA
jgi:hypothetical protein